MINGNIQRSVIKLFNQSKSSLLVLFLRRAIRIEKVSFKNKLFRIKAVSIKLLAEFPNCKFQFCIRCWSYSTHNLNMFYCRLY